MSPLANSLHSSLESGGLSYHTWEADKQDRMLPLVTALEPQPRAWHDLSNPPGELNSAANRDIEEIVQQYVGLNKGDFSQYKSDLYLRQR